jgi:hypothetical protein
MKIKPDEFGELQRNYLPDLTIFPEADNHMSLFMSQIFNKKNRFRGRLIGIFLRPFYFYQQTGLIEKLKYLKHLPTRWRNDERLFFSFFQRQFSLLDIALTIDENFAVNHRYFQWLPDVFQNYADLIVQDKKSEQREWIERLNDFKERNKGKFCLLYFGTAQYRRGYDILLQLARTNGDCFIHCGLRNPDEKYYYKVDDLRSSININGCLFETDQYIVDPFCIENFFKSVSHLVLPYRNFFGSSGIMLQALSYGIPVLTPESGIMGYRIKKFNLGLTYDDKKPTSLNTQFNYFKGCTPGNYSNDIKAYMNHQTPAHLKNVLTNAFIDKGNPLDESLLINL